MAQGPSDTQYGGTTVQGDINGGSPDDGGGASSTGISGSSSSSGGGSSSSGGGSDSTLGLPVTGLELGGFLAIGLAILGTGVAVRRLATADDQA